MVEFHCLNIGIYSPNHIKSFKSTMLSANMQEDNARMLVDYLVRHELGRHFGKFANDYLDALMGLKGSRVHNGLLRPEPCRRTVPDSGVDYSLSLGRVFSLDWKPEVPSYTDLAYHLFLSVAGIYSS